MMETSMGLLIYGRLNSLVGGSQCLSTFATPILDRRKFSGTGLWRLPHLRAHADQGVRQVLHISLICAN